MRIRILLLVVVICLAAIGATSGPAAGQSNTCAPGTTDTTYCQVAPGQYCKGLSKKKLPGQKKSPFAQCTSAMAKLSKKPSMAPSQACASIRTIKGKKNQTKKNKKNANAQFLKCVKGGKQLKLDQANAA
jgi:hypothetical protein